jgi:DNA primase
VKEVDAGLPLSEYLLNELASQVDMQSVDGRARLAELAKPLINKIPPSVYRDLLIDSLAKTVGLATSKVEKMVGESTTKANSGAGGERKATNLLGRRGAVSAGKPSVVRHAITLLLNHPGAAAKLDIEKLLGVQRAGVDLLHALIETVQAEPNITTAGLLERWRHDDQGRHLGKLAVSELPTEEQFDAAAELQACLDQLEIAGKRDRIEILIGKQRLSSLSDDERTELRQLS